MGYLSACSKWNRTFGNIAYTFRWFFTVLKYKQSLRSRLWFAAIALLKPGIFCGLRFDWWKAWLTFCSPGLQYFQLNFFPSLLQWLEIDESFFNDILSCHGFHLFYMLKLSLRLCPESSFILRTYSILAKFHCS